MLLLQVLAYNTFHLTEAATHWHALADQREEVFAGALNEALSLPWEGEAASALHDRAHANYGAAMESAANLRQADWRRLDGRGNNYQRI